jgi:hypothetical protein
MPHLLDFNSRCAVATALAALALATTPAFAASASQTFIPAPPVNATAGAPAGAPADAATNATPPASEQWVEQQTAKIRSEVEARVARGDMTPDEAERLIGWRRYQLEQQAAGQAPAPAIQERQQAVAAAPRPYYAAPYPGPYYAAPYGYAYGPYGYGYPYGYPRYAPGIAVCAGGVGHHFAGGVCF